MSAIRQDAWTTDDDLILAEVTLRHIRDGGTQLAAFEEVGDRIGRTAAACGFRWNSFVRKKYETAIQNAKALRQKRSHGRKTNSVAIELEGHGQDKGESDEQISIDAVIRYLRRWKGTVQEYTRQLKQLQREVQEKDEELQKLRSENEHLKKNVNNVESDYRSVNEDYKALIQIMERARKLTFLSDDEEDQKTRFKMDANGNLERIE